MCLCGTVCSLQGNFTYMISLVLQSPVLLPACSVPGTRLAALQFHLSTLHYSLFLIAHLLFLTLYNLHYADGKTDSEKQARIIFPDLQGWWLNLGSPKALERTRGQMYLQAEGQEFVSLSWGHLHVTSGWAGPLWQAIHSSAKVGEWSRTGIQTQA